LLPAWEMPGWEQYLFRNEVTHLFVLVKRIEWEGIGNSRSGKERI